MKICHQQIMVKWWIGKMCISKKIACNCTIYNSDHGRILLSFFSISVVIDGYDIWNLVMQDETKLDSYQSSILILISTVRISLISYAAKALEINVFATCTLYNNHLVHVSCDLFFVPVTYISIKRQKIFKWWRKITLMHKSQSQSILFSMVLPHLISIHSSVFS